MYVLPIKYLVVFVCLLFSENITIVGRPDFVNNNFKIALYAKETQRYLCFNDHWKLVGMVSIHTYVRTYVRFERENDFLDFLTLQDSLEVWPTQYTLKYLSSSFQLPFD